MANLRVFTHKVSYFAFFRLRCGDWDSDDFVEYFENEEKAAERAATLEKDDKVRRVKVEKMDEPYVENLDEDE